MDGSLQGSLVGGAHVRMAALRALFLWRFRDERLAGTEPV